MTISLFDTHCHLDVSAFDVDRTAVFERAHSAGIHWMVNPAYDLPSSNGAIQVANTFSEVYAAVGIHPNDIGKMTDSSLTTLSQLAASPRVVAIGEIGLDYHWMTESRDRQQTVFQQQLAIANQLHLPVIVHCREAQDDTLATLQEVSDTNRVLLHAYSGTPAQAALAVQRGYYIGIGGPITYKNADSLRLVVDQLPLQHMVLETDAPYLAPNPYRGKRNEPGYIVLTAQKVADLRQISLETLADVTTENARRFFGIS